MFIQTFQTLMAHRRMSALAFPRLTGAHRTRAENDAMQALRYEPTAMHISARLADPAAWQDLQRQRRDALLSLMLVETTPKILSKMTDMVCEICEESIWSANAEGLIFDDENHPDIDVQCAETAMLFAWLVLRLGTRLDPGVIARIRNEVRRRLFKPVAAYTDYDFMNGKGACPMVIAADILFSALILENDEARLGYVVKPVLKLMDAACARHGRELAPIEDVVRDISAITDFVSLLNTATSGRVNLTEHIPVSDWLDEILYSWIDEDLFNNPAGSTMLPALSGNDIFRIGFSVGDDQLFNLGAYLYHRSHLSSRTVTGRMLEGTVCEKLESCLDKPKFLRHSELRNNLLMFSRMPGIYFSMHVGGGRGNAGDLCLLSNGRPILTDGGVCPIRSVPSIAGRAQLQTPAKPCAADKEVRSDREIMSVGLTHAYSASCALRSYQRTAMTLRAENTVRIVDALDLEKPANVSFSFVCGVEPVLAADVIRLESMLMTWEGDLAIRIAPLGQQLHLIELVTREPIRQAFFSFNFEHV